MCPNDDDVPYGCMDSPSIKCFLYTHGVESYFYYYVIIIFIVYQTNKKNNKQQITIIFIIVPLLAPLMVATVYGWMHAIALVDCDPATQEVNVWCERCNAR